MGYREYFPIVDRYRVPIVVTGFEPLDILEGIRRTVLQLEHGEAKVDNAYERIVSEQGNSVARGILNQVFSVCDRSWRGIGTIPRSGWKLAPDFKAFDAEEIFDVSGISAEESALCKSGLVLQGKLKPNECPAFGKECTPRKPLGATMVSSEGACAAYYNNGRFVPVEDLVSA